MANKTRLKHMGRRGLSFFLALVMCISLVQITAFAEGETSVEEQAQKQILQILDGKEYLVYYAYDKDSGWGNAESIPENSDNYVVTNNATNGAPDVKVSKKVTATGTENLFNVTLNVETTQKIKVTENSPDASVVLALDFSKSMTSNKIGNRTRLAVAQEKAIAFLQNYVKDANGAKRMVALVTFDAGAQILDLGGNGTYWIEATSGDNDQDGLNDALGLV